MLEKIKETAEFLQTKVDLQPKVGIVLGTGLGGLVNEIDPVARLSYDQIPNFPVSTVEGHQGALIFGRLGGVPVVAMQGRFHFYEGYTMEQVVFPIRVMKALGITHLMVSNASGGVNPDFEIGDMMIITDHINLFPSNPLLGPNTEALGPRFPDMSEAYAPDLVDKAKAIAQRLQSPFRTGVYAGLSGPCLETPAEYNYIRIIGADAVGMSTVPEVIAAVHMGVPCFAVSVITDLGVPGKIVKVTHEDVQQVASKTEPQLTLLVKEFVAEL
ncbi:MAG: purine-nucleoside phosphorylase [Bacteroidota bacterium]